MQKNINNPQCFALISFFRYPVKNRMWGMMQMNFMKTRLEKEKKLSFFKLLGTGGGFGFSLKPDFATYALLTVWDDLQDAENFETSSEIMNDFRARADEIYSIFMVPIKSRGSWSGISPFITSKTDNDDAPIVVLTRASIRRNQLIRFWANVSAVTNAHKNASGVLFTKGIGELPIIEQATISIWKSTKEMQEFAYNRNGAHAKVVEMTHKYKIFSEELFARFSLIETKGTWRGIDPIKTYQENAGQL